MRSFALMAAILIAPGTAFAGSISTLSGSAATAGSILTIGTPAPVAVKPAAPQLSPGEETVQIRHVDGKTKVYRTEAWLGGSPVTYVTMASNADLAALKRRGIDIASNATQPLPPSVLGEPATEIAGTDIDRTAKTGSLTVGAGDKAPANGPLDAASLKLRLKMTDAAE